MLTTRVGGLPDSLPRRAHGVRQFIGGGEIIDGSEEALLWNEAREFAWIPPEWNLIKVPLTPRLVTRLESELKGRSSRRRYGSGANVAWIATPEPLETWDRLLNSLDLPGLVVIGTPDHVRIGAQKAQALEGRIRAVFDPKGRFPRH